MGNMPPGLADYMASKKKKGGNKTTPDVQAAAAIRVAETAEGLRQSAKKGK